jgi:hypothetical protein
MAENESNLGANIKSRFDPKGTDEAKGAFHNLATGLGASKEQADKLKDSMRDLASALGLVAGASELLEFLKSAAEEAYNDEKAMRAVTQAAITFGVDVAATRKDVQEFTAALAIQTGVIKGDLIDAYAKVYLASGDQKAAMNETTLAANIATTMFKGDMAPAMKLVQAASLGVDRGFRQLTGHVVEGTTAAEKNADMSKFLVERFGDVRKATDDAAMSQARAARRMDELKESIGFVLIPAIHWLRDTFLTIPRTLTLISDLSVVWADSIGRDVKALANLLTYVWQNPLSAWKSYNAERLANQVATDAAIVKTYETNQREFAASEAKKNTAVVTALGFRGKEEKKSTDETLHYDMKAWYDHLDEQARAFVKNQEFMKKEGDKLRKYTDTELKKEAAAQEKIMQGSTKALAEQYKKDAENKRAWAQYKLELEASVVGGTLEMVGTAFGVQKEMAMAAALINAAGAFISALAAPYPMDLILPELVAVQAALQIAKIASSSAPTAGKIDATAIATLSGSSAGFDDASNDRMAYLTGRRWAADMVREIGSGWADGLGGTRAGTTNNTTTIDNSRRTTINAGLMDASNTESVKKLIRQIRMVDSNVLGQTTVAARTR